MLTISFFPSERSDQLGEASRLIGKYKEHGGEDIWTLGQ